MAPGHFRPGPILKQGKKRGRRTRAAAGGETYLPVRAGDEPVQSGEYHVEIVWAQLEVFR
jgi:hypothetical protein